MTVAFQERFLNMHYFGQSGRLPRYACPCGIVHVRAMPLSMRGMLYDLASIGVRVPAGN